MVSVGGTSVHIRANGIRRRLDFVSAGIHSPRIAIVTANDLCAGHGTTAMAKCLSGRRGIFHFLRVAERREEIGSVIFGNARCRTSLDAGQTIDEIRFSDLEAGRRIEWRNC